MRMMRSRVLISPYVIMTRSLMGLYFILASLIIVHVHTSLSGSHDINHDHLKSLHMRKLQQIIQRESTSSEYSPSPSPPASPSPRVYKVTSYGADPTGKTDSTDAILQAISDAVRVSDSEAGFGLGLNMMQGGSVDFGGVRINLEGGLFKISRPIKLPVTCRGNLMIHGGTLKATFDFPTDGYMIDLSAPLTTKYNFEYVTLRDLMLDVNYRGGGIQVIGSYHTDIDNCYIVHFMTNGILVQSGHETYIRNSYLGQNVTTGGGYGDKNLTGTAINLVGIDNAITDVVISSVAVG